MFIANLPPIKCNVRAEFLTQGESNQLWPCYWISVKSVPGQNYYFEIYLPEMGAVYDKLPIGAFIHTNDIRPPQKPPHALQMWDCMAWGVVAIEKMFLARQRCEVRFLDNEVIGGNYVLTLDGYSPNNDTIDTGTAHVEEEHKCHNLIALDNGQYCLAPNNRILWAVSSVTSEKRRMYPLKVRTTHYTTEGYGGQQFGDTDKFNYEK